MSEPHDAACAATPDVVTSGASLSVSVARDMQAWERFVESVPDSTFCHLAGWREIMSDVMGHECLYLVASDEADRIRGVLPLVRVRSVLGHYLVSVPFVNDGGPIGDEDAVRALTDFAVAAARRTNAELLELRCRRELVAAGIVTSFRKVGVHLPLPESVKELWTRTFNAKLRNQIRRPGKDGMTTRIGPDQLTPFYRVFSRNMRDLGTPVLPAAFFERLVAVFGERVMFVTVQTAAGLPVAASCCLTWRGEMEVTWASSLREFNHVSPNMLLYATMMEEAVTRGVRVFNFGRSSPGAPTHRFKQQWGGTDVALPWAFWSRGADVGTPSADSPALQLAVAVWRRLPLAIANRLGPILSRHLP